MKIKRIRIEVYKKNTRSANSEILTSFSFPEARIDFTVSQVDTERPDTCLFRIFGISKDTYNQIKMPKETEDNEDIRRVQIWYGYDNDMDIIYNGIMNRSIYSFQNGEQVFTAIIDQDNKKFSNLCKKISIQDKTILGNVLRIIANKYGYSIMIANEVNETISIGRYSYTGDIEGALKSLLSKKYSFYIAMDKIYVYGFNHTITKNLTISMESGLLSYPTEDSNNEKTYIKTKLLPYVESGLILNIPIDENGLYSPIDTGNYRYFTVNTYKSTFRNGSGNTYLECDENVG